MNFPCSSRARGQDERINPWIRSMNHNQSPEQEARDKTNLDIFWLKDKSLADLDNLPDPDILANEIIENIEAGLESFKEIVETLNGNGK